MAILIVELHRVAPPSPREALPAPPPEGSNIAAAASGFAA